MAVRPEQVGRQEWRCQAVAPVKSSPSSGPGNVMVGLMATTAIATEHSASTVANILNPIDSLKQATATRPTVLRCDLHSDTTSSSPS
jgi:hypothetical protein